MSGSLVNVFSDGDDDVISDGWIDTVRASLEDNNQRRAINSKRSPPAPITSYGDVKSRPITV